MKVSVCNICRSFGTVKAADHVSFELESGSVYGFVGPNGSGKTTLLRIMAGVDRPDFGDVLYDDISVTMYPDRARQFIGYMPDALPNFRDMTVWEYLDFFARSFGLQGEERRRELGEVGAFTGISGFLGQPLVSLSKGMKQRVSLARALLHHPQVLLLDEPAAGLDPRARHDLRMIMKELATRNMTIFLSSHILSELEDMCDGAVILAQGRVVAAGKICDLQGQLDGRQQAKEAKLVLCIKVRGAAELACKTLAGMPECDQPRRMPDGQIDVTLHGGDELIPKVLLALLTAGVEVIGVTHRQASLEELFIHFTDDGSEAAKEEC